MNFIDKKVSVNKAIATLAKNGIQVDEVEGTVILDFLYLIAKSHNRPEEGKNIETLRGNRTLKKML